MRRDSRWTFVRKMSFKCNVCGKSVCVCLMIAFVMWDYHAMHITPEILVGNNENVASIDGIKIAVLNVSSFPWYYRIVSCIFAPKNEPQQRSFSTFIFCCWMKTVKPLKSSYEFNEFHENASNKLKLAARFFFLLVSAALNDPITLYVAYRYWIDAMHFLI